VRRTVDRGGKLLIPAFSVGRTQTVLYFLHQLAGAGRLDGAFWSLLFGCLLSIPFSPAPDAAADLLSRAFSEFGIDRDFLELAHHRMIEGTSTLFLLSHHPISDRLNAIMRRTDLPYELITTQLSAEKAARLHQVFVAPALESSRLDTPSVANGGVRRV